MPTSHRVVLIDDDPDIGEYVCTAAEGLGMPCLATSDPVAFLAALTPETTLIFLDLVIPQIDGVELLRRLSKLEHKPPIILMSGIGKRVLESVQTLAETLGLSIVGHLEKPFRLVDLEMLLTRHVEKAPEPVAGDREPTPLTEGELISAISRNEFILHYQPQIEIATGQVSGVEALVRWQHPARGLIFPDSFIPLAESLGRIDELGWLVAVRGLSEIAGMISETGRRLTLSINVSVQTLRDIAFPDRIASLIAGHHLQPENVVLEITESGLIQELTRTLDTLTRLRMKGLGLSIDDFGTGYSVMKQLRHTPATELKIDKSFVQNLHSNDADNVLVRKTIEIGKELGMKTVGEGVETKDQLDFLRTHDCDYAQGYFFSRPLPPQTLKNWLAAYHPLATR